MKPKKQIKFVVCPTDYGDYDVLAIGCKSLLIKLAKKEKYFHIIHSNSMEMSLVILDTCDTIQNANHIIKEYKILYEKDTNEKN